MTARRLLAVLTVVLLGAGLAAAPASAAPAAPAAPAAQAAPRVSATASSTPPATSWPDWYAYHQTGARHGYSSALPAVSKIALLHNLTLDGAVYASPITVDGITIVATENDTVYAFDPYFRLLWKVHLGTPARSTQLPCGNIDPLGITGTPTYAAVTGLVYVAPEFGNTAPSHQLYGMSLKTGAVAFHQSLDLPGVSAAAMQQRGALLTTGAGVFVPFGGLAGDCSDYKGRVVRYALDGSGTPASFTVPTTREAGIWTPPGPTYDGANVYVAVGNGESGVGDPYDYSDSVLKLAPTSLARVDSFSPSTWPTDNDADLDLGSQGPAVVGDYVFSAGKSGTAYVLRRSALGGIGGQVSSASVCKSFGGTAVVGSTVYVPCSDGLRAVSIDSAGAMHVRWHAASNITGSPVVGGGRVWAMDPAGGRLYAVNPTTGATVTSIAVGVTNRFATPSIFGHHVQVGTLKGVAVVNAT